MASIDAARSERRRKRTEIGSDGKPYKLRGDIEVLEKPTAKELRTLRSDLYSVSSRKRRVVPASSMVSSSISRSSFQHSRPISKHRHKSTNSRRPEAETQQHRKRKAISRDGDESYISVYGPPRPRERSTSVNVPERRTARRDDVSSQSSYHGPRPMPAVFEESEMESQSEQELKPEPEPEPKPRKAKAIYITNERPKSSRHGSHRGGGEDGRRKKDEVKASMKSVHRSNTTSSHRIRSQSVQDIRESRPVLKRSSTTSASYVPTKIYEPSLTSTRNTKKRGSANAGFFGLFAPMIKEEKPIRLVECLTCLSDDIPISKSAKLKCGHRMCHSCLKRIFKLSVNDPQHMPPKCCISDHIPLKHVERLFDNSFKKLWNLKFQEYTTKNRIYCPSRRCGEWIKPGNIHSEGGKKYGKCSRCKTKVCSLCNARWHGNKDCPKDEETNKLLEAAKQEGWQRCYSCRTMVELKEGCNHMTCRCRAEFCMICGLKWKTCNCPWFNYDQVENDRLNNMRVPGEFDFDLIPDALRIPERLDIFGLPQRRPRVYHEELGARRRQELLDEELARRVQILGIDDDDDDDDHNDGIGNIDGLGNAQGHFMNNDYRRPAPNARTRNYVAGIDGGRGILPPHPVPQLRRRAEGVNPAPVRRPAERPILRRPRTDFVSDTARRAPIAVLDTQRRARPPRLAPVPVAEPRPSVLAGLGGPGRGSGRVSAWRAHVEPGVTPAEGVLSM